MALKMSAQERLQIDSKEVHLIGPHESSKERPQNWHLEYPREGHQNEPQRLTSNLAPKKPPSGPQEVSPKIGPMWALIVFLLMDLIHHFLECISLS